MEFLKILKGHFWTYGIIEPLEYLAARLDVNVETIRVYCRQANNGVGHEKDQLSPKTAAWLIEESFKVMEPGDMINKVQEFLESKKGDQNGR